jgi:hypothetical protein
MFCLADPPLFGRIDLHCHFASTCLSYQSLDQLSANLVSGGGSLDARVVVTLEVRRFEFGDRRATREEL